jgi:hypothetical protein
LPLSQDRRIRHDDLVLFCREYGMQIELATYIPAFAPSQIPSKVYTSLMLDHKSLVGRVVYVDKVAEEWLETLGIKSEVIAVIA